MIRSRGRHRRPRTSRGVVVTLVLALMVSGAAAGNVHSSRQSGAAPTARPAAAETDDCGLEWSGWKEFTPGESYVGCDGAKLTFQASDGNLVIQEADGTVRWATNKPAAGGRVVFQGSSDGNLLVKDSTGKVVWSTDVAAPGGRLVFKADHNLDVFNSSGLPAWWSNRHEYCKEYSWAPGKVITPGEKYVGCTGDMLTMQKSDGNLVYYNQLKEVAWATNANAKDGQAVFQPSDGNFVVYNAAKQPVWSTDAAAPGGKLSFGPGVPITVRNSAGDLAYAETDPVKTAVHEAWQKAREDLDKAHAKGMPDDRWQQARKALDEAEAKALGIKSNEPCTTLKDVISALADVATAVIAYLTPGAGEVKAGTQAIQWISQGKASFALLDILIKCGILDQIQKALPGLGDPSTPLFVGAGGSGAYGVVDLIGQGPTFVWVDLVPAGQDADAHIYFEGESGYIDYDHQYVTDVYGDGGGGVQGSCIDVYGQFTLFCTDI